MRQPCARVATYLQQRAAASPVGVLQQVTPPVLSSTIIGGNIGGYDLECNGCTVGGSKNLVQNPDPGVTLPADTITLKDPKLAPLGNNGGTVAGASGNVLTGPMPTHILYLGSPAIDKGENLESFSFDQRGSGFARTTGAATDIGALEGAIVAPAPGAAIDVPALGPWMLGLLAALVGFFGALRRRRSP